MSQESKDIEKEIEKLEEVYDTGHEIGEQNINPLGLDLHNPVFVVSALLILLFVIGALVFPDAASNGMTAAREWIGESFHWLFLSAGNIFVLFCLLLILLPVGKIRIGGEDAKPDFSVISWFSMLFAAGMGIGLMFWSVAEPVGYFTEWFGTPLDIAGGTEESRQAALGATMYHWGLHPWAIYAVVGLSLAFFTYNKGLPLTIRSAFYPLLGDRIWGPFGHVIDTLAVLATMFGLATSLGFGAQQAASGLEFLFGIDGGLQTQVAIIIVVTIVALLSVMRGIHGGVRVLSNINLAFAALLLLFVLIAGGIVAFLNNAATTITGYVQYMLPLSNPVGREDETFYHGWTIFFWAWWISWSPFVG
ncbi:MAG: BCCT family transporter, partial [Thioalkalivibrio sp.]